VPIDIRFLSETDAEVKSKGKTLPARVKALAAFSPPARVSSDVAKEAADVSAEQQNPLVVFDALANDGAVRPKEFAIIVQLQASAALKAAAFGMLEKAPINPAVKPEITAAVKPAIKRGVERLDVSHMRTLLEMLFRVIDGNKNGKIEREEFESFFNKVMGLAVDPALAMDFAFSMVDKNGNGKLSLDEAQEVIDAVMELASTLVASFADVADTIVNDPDFKEAAIHTLKGAMLAPSGAKEGDCLGGCDGCGKQLPLSPDWFHKVGGSYDYCKECLDKYEGEDKAQFVVIDTREKLGTDAGKYGVDFSNLVSRDDLASRLEQSGAMDTMAKVFADDGSKGPKQQLVNSLKLVREAFAKSESNVGGQFYMKAMEWSQGGVDEATFVCQVVPLLRENQKAEMEKMQADPMGMVQQQLEAMSHMGSPVPEEHKAMIGQGVQAASSEVLPALKRGVDRGSEYLPEYARALFRFLDIDGSGFITKKEIQLLKALLDALLHLGERACHDMSVAEVWKVGDQAVFIDDEAEVKRRFDASVYVWNDGMKGMLGKTFPVLSVSVADGQGIVGLPSPDGSQGGEWLFPDTLLVKSTLKEVCKPMEGDYKDNAKELAFAIFDVLDRDGDKHLSLEEIVTFGQKLATFGLSMTRTMAHMTIECMLDELFKAMAAFGWKAKGLEEVEKEQFLPMIMMVPMAAQGMMQQGVPQ